MWLEVELLTNLLISFFQTQDHQSETCAFSKEYRSMDRFVDGNPQAPFDVNARKLLSMQRHSCYTLEIL